MSTQTLAHKAREMHAKDPTLRRAEIARRLGCTRQAVDQALRTTRARGRPALGQRNEVDGDVIVRLRMPAELVERATKTAKRKRRDVHAHLVRVIDEAHA